MTDFTRFSSYFERRHMEERMGKNSQNKKSQKNGNEKLSEKRRLSHSREVVEIHASHLTCQSRKEIDATQKLCLTYELL